MSKLTKGRTTHLSHTHSPYYHFYIAKCLFCMYSYIFTHLVSHAQFIIHHPAVISILLLLTTPSHAVGSLASTLCAILAQSKSSTKWCGQYERIAGGSRPKGWGWQMVISSGSQCTLDSLNAFCNVSVRYSWTWSSCNYTCKYLCYIYSCTKRRVKWTTLHMKVSSQMQTAIWTVENSSSEYYMKTWRPVLLFHHHPYFTCM